jgi:hypothetical protein
MPETKAEVTITAAGVVGITLTVPPGLHGLRELLDGVRRSTWAFEALDAAVRFGCRQKDVLAQDVSHEKEQ